ncbi:MAG: GNAT family N-acetyltransferase [Ruminococcus sp.]|nr:GNAT family N-acetyltransferase [Ruminococcus sp.]
MEHIIRALRPEEFPLLEDFLYEAIFIPEGVQPPPREIIRQPEIWLYIEDFGTEPWDIAYAAEVSGKVVGAAWVRIMDDYGHIDDDTPSLAIALYSQFRSKGLGTELMAALMEELRKRGCKRVSLSVQKENRAVGLYRKCGFEVLSDKGEELIMAASL